MYSVQYIQYVQCTVHISETEQYVQQYSTCCDVTWAHHHLASHFITSLHILSHHFCFTSYHIIISASHLITSSLLHIWAHHHLCFTSYHFTSYHIMNIAAHLSHHLCFTSYHIIISASHLTTSSLLHILSHNYLSFTSYHTIISASHLPHHYICFISYNFIIISSSNL